LRYTGNVYQVAILDPKFGPCRKFFAPKGLPVAGLPSKLLLVKFSPPAGSAPPKNGQRLAGYARDPGVSGIESHKPTFGVQLGSVSELEIMRVPKFRDECWNDRRPQVSQHDN
jgi:hypothetical protein